MSDEDNLSDELFLELLKKGMLHEELLKRGMLPKVRDEALAEQMPEAQRQVDLADAKRRNRSLGSSEKRGPLGDRNQLEECGSVHVQEIIFDDEFARSSANVTSPDWLEQIPPGALLVGYNEQIYETINLAFKNVFARGAPGENEIFSALPLEFIEISEDLFVRVSAWAGKHSDQLSKNEFGASLSVYTNFVFANYAHRWGAAGQSAKTGALLKLGAACRELELIILNKAAATAGRGTQRGGKKGGQSKAVLNAPEMTKRHNLYASLRAEGKNQSEADRITNRRLKLNLKAGAITKSFKRSQG